MMFLIKNMKLLFSVLLITFFSLSLSAQTIKVIDVNSNEPIVGVAIYNKSQTKSEITNLNGEANLGRFDATEMLFFQHISHVKHQVRKSNISNSLVVLSPNEQGLDEIVISASNFGQTKREIPKTIATVNAKDISFNNPQTSADLLEGTGQVYIQKSQLGGGSPMIRGFSANRILLSLDGIRMNNAIFRSGNIHNIISIDPNILEGVEILLSSMFCFEIFNLKASKNLFFIK